MKRVTLKDIAERCKVTPTLVSAVLNHRNGRIACSEERRMEILSVAEELKYRPNLLARSMVAHQVPLVGIMLHLREEYFWEWGFHYLMRVLPALTFALNRRNLECIFIPYRMEEEQLQRAESLISNGLLGGIITNIDPKDHQKICSFLQNAKLPYMILGRPKKTTGLHHAFSTMDYEALFKDMLSGFRRVYMVSQENGKPIFCRMPLPDNYFWAADFLMPPEEEFHSEETCFLLMGQSISDLLKKEQIICRHIIIVETPENRPLIEPRVPFVTISQKIGNGFFSTVADRLADWMQTGKEPEGHQLHIQCAQINLAEKNLTGKE